ncbi:MAG: cytochrome c-type biogenesis protein [Myxococcota bacterium]
MSTSLLLCWTLLAQAPRMGAGPEVHEQNDEVYAIGELLRCPVCQGMPIAESPSSMAQDMMGRVREMHAEGQDREQILDYFVGRYGEWVLLEPKHRGFGLLVWALPPFGLLASVVIALAWIRRRPKTATTPDESTSQKGPAPTAVRDDDLEAIRREVRE